ncbi:hypothetical protein LCGC14_2172300, partial [marine sediment metagenome]
MTVTDVLLSGLVIVAFGCGVGYLAYIVKGRMEKRKVLNKEQILKRLDEQVFIDVPEPEYKDEEDKPKPRPKIKISGSYKKKPAKKIKKVAFIGKNPGKRKDP